MSVLFVRLIKILLALLMDFLNTDEKKQRRLVHLPMGRFGEAVELANAALFCKYFRCRIQRVPYPPDLLAFQWPATRAVISR
jgi:hypothetical protein